MFEDIEDKQDKGNVAFVSYQHENPVHSTTEQDMNTLLVYGYEFNDY